MLQISFSINHGIFLLPLSGLWSSLRILGWNTMWELGEQLDQKGRDDRISSTASCLHVLQVFFFFFSLRGLPGGPCSFSLSLTHLCFSILHTKHLCSSFYTFFVPGLLQVLSCLVLFVHEFLRNWDWKSDGRWETSWTFDCLTQRCLPIWAFHFESHGMYVCTECMDWKPWNFVLMPWKGVLKKITFCLSLPR